MIHIQPAAILIMANYGAATEEAVSKPQKRIEFDISGEYKIRPYRGFQDLGRGEPCVHPLVLRQPPESRPYKTIEKFEDYRDFEIVGAKERSLCPPSYYFLHKKSPDSARSVFSVAKIR